MPKVSIDTILCAVFDKFKNRPTPTARLTYKDFAEIMRETDIYSAEVSIKSAWVRVKGSGCVVAVEDDGRSYIFNIAVMKYSYGEQAAENIKTKTNTQTKAGAF